MTVWFGVDDDDYLIIGDLNSYAMEDPIRALVDAGFVDLADKAGETYSYGFDGQWGTLDYVFASPSFATRARETTVWHINADEPIIVAYNTDYKSAAQIDYFYNDAYYRASDHDPIIVGLNTTTWYINLPLVIRK